MNQSSKKNLNIFIFFSSFDKQNLQISVKKLKFFLKKLLINYDSMRLPSKKKKITLLRSPHVHKKSKEQFEKIIYKEIIVLYKKDLYLDLIKNFLSGLSHIVDINLKIKN